MKNYRVLIIGNGFDLDLGLKSSYSEFMKSSQWSDCSRGYLQEADLLHFLTIQAPRHNWFDLENQLSEFAKLKNNVYYADIVYTPDKNKKQFMELCLALMDYLTQEQETFTSDKDSVSAYFLTQRMEMFFSAVYSFNYTDINSLYRRVVGCEPSFMGGLPNNIQALERSCSHIHGSLKNKTAIIGVADGMDLIDGYSFLYKTFNPYFHSTNLYYDLKEAREVVFFGHSLGPQDYHYFHSFFNDCCVPYSKTREGKKRIVFVTKDENSRIQLLEQIRKMNDRKTDLFFLLNNVHFIYTADRKKAKERLKSLHSYWYRDLTGTEYNGE